MNGYRSSRRYANYRIRQGCSLAPLLFIFALDSFVYRMIQVRDIRGVSITARGWTTDLKGSGCANDTGVYLRDRSTVLPVVKILDNSLTCQVS